MSEITRDDVLASRDLVAELERRGVQVIGSGNERKAKCPIHQERTPSFSINVQKQAWNCFGCGTGGSVIDLIAKLDGKDPKVVYKELADALKNEPAPPAKTFSSPASMTAAQPNQNAPEGQQKVRPKIAVIYPYQDQNGNEVFQVIRTEPKGFRQRHKDSNGQWVWNMEGITRCLFRLPEILRSQEVWLCEGEKDVLSLVALGFEATTNPGGSSKWLDSYSESLFEKDIVLCGDNDAPGQKHLDVIAKSLEGKVASIRRVKVPDPHKDITEYLDSLTGDLAGKKALVAQLKDCSFHMRRGIDLPLYTMAELEEKYKAFVAENAKSPVDLGLWLPSFRHHCRPLVPGDLVAILAATGAGKTAALQNLCTAFKNLPAILFELELSDEAMFERVLGERGGFTGSEVERAYTRKESFGKDAMEGTFANLLICTKPKLTVSQIDAYCQKAELKLGQPPKIILLDYIQLAEDDEKADSRYSKYSNIAEALRTMAKQRKAVVIFTSQVQRKKPDESQEVHLSDGKESGSIENSSSLVLGLWREYEDDTGTFSKTCIRILKHTRGVAGATIECNWAPTMKISERTQEEIEQKPRHKN